MRYATLLLLCVAASAFAQTGRESYRVPYQAWRQTAPGLEQDASAPGAEFAGQVAASAAAAQAFFNARAAYLAPQPEQSAWASKPLATAEGLLTTPRNVEQLLAVRAARLGTEVGAFSADDKDPAIRRVRQAIERERVALRALMETLTARKVPLTELIDRSDEAEVERAAVFQTVTAANARRNQLAEHVKREAADWAVYYKGLLEGSAGGRTLTTTGPASSAPKIVRPSANGQIPMGRYTGEWLFPSKGLFYGPQPESVEMTVMEDGGRMSGSLSAKFVAPTSTLTLAFEGAVQQAKTQNFAVKTGDGSEGTIEFIPGSAINLLEVNFQAAGVTGNFILVKR